MPEDKRLVYVLKSANPKDHYYIGLTSDARARLAAHNAGRCPHTARYRPWHLHVTIELPDEERAVYGALREFLFPSQISLLFDQE